MYYGFECIIKDGKHLTIACGIYIKSDYLDILKDEYEITVEGIIMNYLMRCLL